MVALDHIHLCCMVNDMKTTLNLDDSIMALLKREAVRRGCTMSELMESALRLLFKSRKSKRDLPALPTFKSGGHLVDIADRDALNNIHLQ
jgi:hypothetical protein